VAFDSTAHNLVPNDRNLQSDVFVHDLVRRTTARVSLGAFGTEGNSQSVGASMSGDGRFVAFVSSATNLVPLDTNVWCVIVVDGTTFPVNCPDIYVHDRLTRTTERVNVTTLGRQARGESYGPSISRTGRVVAFQSQAPNLVAGDTNQGADIFVRDRLTRRTSRVSLTHTGAQSSCAGFYPNRCAIGAAIDDVGRVITFQGNSPSFVPGDINDAEDIFVRDRLGTADAGSAGCCGTTGTRQKSKEFH
jgi:Tol biopolymer transport system component